MFTLYSPFIGTSLYFHSVAVNLGTGWYTLKDCPSIRYVNVERLAQKLLPRESIAEWKEKDNWQGIVVELRYFLKLKAERCLTRTRVVHALLVTDADVEFINDVISTGNCYLLETLRFALLSYA